MKHVEHRFTLLTFLLTIEHKVNLNIITRTMSIYLFNEKYRKSIEFT